jgi:alkylation response protein AidB-like acyl-CoA dehydrogenase
VLRSGTALAEGNSDLKNGAESVLIPRRPTGHLPAETAVRSMITQIYEGTNQIQRVVMARQLLK